MPFSETKSGKERRDNRPRKIVPLIAFAPNKPAQKYMSETSDSP
jgi:hypothetical protein